MKSLINTLLFLLISVPSFAQIDCSPFKTGKFQNFKDGVAKAKIERTETVQTEFIGEVVIKLSIKWLDECSYQLSFLDGNAAYWDREGSDEEVPDLIVRIISVDENSYTQECKFVGIEDFTYVSTIVQLE